MNTPRPVRFGSLLIVSLLVSSACADVAVSGLFSDHMVLQRDMPLPVWGSARPGEEVAVTLANRKGAAKADAAGRWRVTLESLPAGGPLVLTITGRNTLAIKDVLVGEVWVCSGQSNMAFAVPRAVNGKEEAAQAAYPKIRLLKVARRPADEPGDDVGGHWQICSPDAVADFSAVGYFFGRDLEKSLNVPIGLIDSSVGGTPAESWTPRPVLEADPALKVVFDNWQKRIAAAEAAERKQAAGSTERRQATRPAGRRATRSVTTRPAPGQAGTRARSGVARPAYTAAQLRRSSQRPAVLYNAMIHPLVPYAIRGVIWYQGEANTGRAYQYRKLFPAMIESWRRAWGQGGFPFLFVQLAGCQRGQKAPYESAWAELREAQTMTLSLPKTGMAVITDVSEANNIHPANKQEVGKRLALAARAVAYGQKIAYSGPLYDSMSVEGDKIRIKFKHAEGGLEARGGPLKGFAVAGDDRKFVEATATIDGEAVLVGSDKVDRLAAVRFGWADVPDGNLYNKAGLPASPFRTDDWPGVTALAK